MNIFKTTLLMVGLTLLLIWAGSMIGGKDGMIIAFVMAGIINFISYWFSDKIVLMMYGAKEAKESEKPKLYSTVRQLTQSANLPMPRLYFIDTPMPNAFATGRDPQHAAVAVTKGILDLLDDNELSGVIAHELSHIKNRDVLVATIAATIAGAIFMLSRTAQFAAMFGGSNRDRRGGGGGIGMLLVAILAPIAAMIIQMAISRSREYHADATGAKISGNPMALANALQKLESGVQRNPANVNPTTAHMFIVNPLSGKSFSNIFSTHPPIEERIKRLRQILS